jgi:prolyl-tRNA synthetase
MAAIVEQHNDEHGITWPLSVAPYDVHVVALAAGNPEVASIADRSCAELEAGGLEVLLDDRDLRPGEKFADADLIGCPVRVTIGKKTLEDGKADVLRRPDREEKRIAVESLVDHVKEAL